MVALGGVALMLWFRDQGWHWAGGLIAALAFGYGASMAWRIQHIGQVLSLAYLPIAHACASTGRWRAARSSTASPPASSRPCIVLGRDQVALLAIYLLAAFGLWRILVGAAAARRAARAACCRSGPARSCALALIAVPVLLTALLAQDSNRPSIDYIGAARGSLHPALLLTLVMPDVFGASGRMEDYWGPPSFAWPDTGLFIAQNMGQLYIGAIPLLLLLDGRRARPAVGAGDPLLHLRGGRGAALCARLVHAGLPRALRAAARRRPLPPAGGRDVPDRRAGRDPGRLCARTGCFAIPAAELAPPGRRSSRPRRWRGRRSCCRSLWGCGSAACRGCPCRCAGGAVRLPPRRWRSAGRRRA